MFDTLGCYNSSSVLELDDAIPSDKQCPTSFYANKICCEGWDTGSWTPSNACDGDTYTQERNVWKTPVGCNVRTPPHKPDSSQEATGTSTSEICEDDDFATPPEPPEPPDCGPAPQAGPWGDFCQNQPAYDAFYNVLHAWQQCMALPLSPKPSCEPEPPLDPIDVPDTPPTCTTWTYVCSGEDASTICDTTSTTHQCTIGKAPRGCSGIPSGHSPSPTIQIQGTKNCTPEPPPVTQPVSCPSGQILWGNVCTERCIVYPDSQVCHASER